MARIPKWLFVVVPVNLVAIGLGVVGVTVLDPEASATCDNAVSLYFDNDASMRAAAERLRTVWAPGTQPDGRRSSAS